MVAPPALLLSDHLVCSYRVRSYLSVHHALSNDPLFTQRPYSGYYTVLPF